MNETPHGSQVGIIVIGRNEGARLVACLDSIGGDADHVIYVDSGSTDDSIVVAEKAGAHVVLLDTNLPFTAARARNAGLERLRERSDQPTFIQFIDGDCILCDGWLRTASCYLSEHPDIAVVCGRRREQFPEASVFNRMIDAEWDTPTGEAKACGGDAMMRAAALDDVGGFNPGLIAGEEPELCLRLRREGWKIWRLDAEMTWHDAALMRASQWWQRCRRAGYAFAEGAALHGASPERHWVTETRRSLFWGVGLPIAILAGLVITPWALALAALWLMKIARLVVHGFNFQRAAFLTLGNIPESLGVLSYYWRSLTGATTRLIEYK